MNQRHHHVPTISNTVKMVEVAIDSKHKGKYTKQTHIRHIRIQNTHPVNRSSKKQTPKSTHPQITNKHPSHAKTLNNILPVSRLIVDLKGQKSSKDIKVRCKKQTANSIKQSKH